MYLILYYQLRQEANVESKSSMENIIILIFNKPSKRGPDNTRQVPIIDAII